MSQTQPTTLVFDLSNMIQNFNSFSIVGYHNNSLAALTDFPDNMDDQVIIDHLPLLYCLSNSTLRDFATFIQCPTSANMPKSVLHLLKMTGTLDGF